MRSIFKILLFAMTMITLGISAYAQKDNRQPKTREQVAEAQAKYIAKEMAMNDATAEKFIATFCHFQKEIWALGPDPKESLRILQMQRPNKPLKSDSSIAKRYLTCGRSIMKNIVGSCRKSRLYVYTNWKKR